MTEGRKLYSGIFFEKNDLHVTWEFGQDTCTLPINVMEGDEAEVIITGILIEPFIIASSCRVVYNSGKPSGEELRILSRQHDHHIPLHITHYYDKRVAPKIAGELLLDIPHSNYKEFLNPIVWKGHWGYKRTEPLNSRHKMIQDEESHYESLEKSFNAPYPNTEQIGGQAEQIMDFEEDILNDEKHPADLGKV